MSRYLGILLNPGIALDYWAYVLVAGASYESGKLRKVRQDLMPGLLGNRASS